MENGINYTANKKKFPMAFSLPSSRAFSLSLSLSAHSFTLFLFICLAHKRVWRNLSISRTSSQSTRNSRVRRYFLWLWRFGTFPVKKSARAWMLIFFVTREIFEDERHNSVQIYTLCGFHGKPQYKGLPPIFMAILVPLIRPADYPWIPESWLTSTRMTSSTSSITQLQVESNFFFIKKHICTVSQ